MPEVYRSEVIGAPVQRVWALVRDFNALPRWTSFVAASRIEGGMPADRIGCIRHFRLQDGGTIREKLLMLDDAEMACRYSIIDSPMNVENYTAVLRLRSVSRERHCFAEWSATFDCPAAEETALVRQIGDGVFATALAQLRKRFGGNG
ncbi:MAG: SRPBCC family protein [Pseudomonadota bacterium]